MTSSKQSSPRSALPQLQQLSDYGSGKSLHLPHGHIASPCIWQGDTQISAPGIYYLLIYADLQRPNPRYLGIYYEQTCRFQLSGFITFALCAEEQTIFQINVHLQPYSHPLSYQHNTHCWNEAVAFPMSIC